MSAEAVATIDTQFEEFDAENHTNCIHAYKTYAIDSPNDLWVATSKGFALRQEIIQAGILLRASNSTRFPTLKKYKQFLIEQFGELRHSAEIASAGEIARAVFAQSRVPSWDNPIHIRQFTDQQLTALLTSHPSGEKESFFLAKPDPITPEVTQ